MREGDPLTIVIFEMPLKRLVGEVVGQCGVGDHAIVLVERDQEAVESGFVGGG